MFVDFASEDLRKAKLADDDPLTILEWCNVRRTVLDRDGRNGVFLASHDPTVKALIYKNSRMHAADSK